MNRRIVTAALIASSMLFALTSHAQEGGLDEVTLKNGGAIRGTVVASEPGTSVKIIEMGQKEVRVIPWSQVSDVERGKYAPKAPAQPGPAGPGYGAAPPPAPVEPKVGAPGVVRLHVDSPVPAQVIEHVGTTVGGIGGYAVVMTQLRPVCTSPCDHVIDGSKGQAFALAGAFPVPRAFTLIGYTGDVSVTLKPGSLGRRTGGVWATIIGGTALLSGAFMLPLAYILPSDTTSGPSPGMKNAGIGLLVGGGVTLVGGIVLLATSGSKIRIDQGAPAREVGKIEPRYWMGEF